jgi:hypothetical protein
MVYRRDKEFLDFSIKLHSHRSGKEDNEKKIMKRR